MDPESRLLDLMAEWNEAVLAGKAVSIEGLAPNDPVLQNRLRDALRQQKSEKTLSGMQGETSTGVYVPNDSVRERPFPDPPGFLITREIGRGGMGLVFEAEDILLGRKVAIKTIRPELAVSGEAKIRFLQEARAAASIQSDHVVTIHRVDEVNGLPFIAMEFLKGQSLYLWMKEHQASPSHICRIGHEMALGLMAAHEAGHIHRDIKPANIWLEAPNGRVKILDFGLARSIEIDLRLTSTGVVLGTPSYMAPEQARNENVDHRSDLFSLGAILFQLATGRRPFQGRDIYEVLENLNSAKPTQSVQLINKSIGPDLGILIDHLLAKKPADRPQSARKVAMELRRIHKQLKAGASQLHTPISLPQAVPVEYVPAPLMPAQSSQYSAAWTDIELAAIPSFDKTVTPPQADNQRPAQKSPIWIRLGILAAAFLIVLMCAAILLKLILNTGPTPKSGERRGSTILHSST